MPYLFFLGRSEDLSTAELSVFFPNAKRLSDTMYQVEESTVSYNKQTLPIAESIKFLGGTVKIAEIISTVSDLEPLTLAKYLSDDLQTKITFGFSSYEGVPKISQANCSEVKDLLEQQGRKVRFVLPSEHNIVSSVAVAKQHVLEINIIKVQSGYLLAKTIGIQEFEEWANRDYGRPAYDSKKGMLPPKVSRMAVNIAIGADATGKTILDPFCGMGTIPGEAILRGAIAMGSDTAKEAIDKAKKNSVWLRSSNPNLPPITYFVADATHVSQMVRSGTIDAIVTEPFMGSPKLGEGKITDKKDIKNAIKGLEKLYIGCLREWAPLLKPGGIVMIALPEIVVANTVYPVKSVIDSCETLGYTKQLGPLSYSRPQAVVRRMFYLFRRND